MQVSFNQVAAVSKALLRSLSGHCRLHVSQSQSVESITYSCNLAEVCSVNSKEGLVVDLILNLGRGVKK